MEKDCKDCKKAIPNGDSGHEWKCTADEYDIEGKTCFEPRSESLDEVISNQDQQPVVSFIVHEADMNRVDTENERLHDTHKSVIRTICQTFIGLILIFVVAYTLRTALWQRTVLELKDAIVQTNERVVELAKMFRESVEVNHAEKANTP